jgi:hypothetical protein
MWTLNVRAVAYCKCPGVQTRLSLKSRGSQYGNGIFPEHATRSRIQRRRHMVMDTAHLGDATHPGTAYTTDGRRPRFQLTGLPSTEQQAVHSIIAMIMCAVKGPRSALSPTRNNNVGDRCLQRHQAVGIPASLRLPNKKQRLRYATRVR